MAGVRDFELDDAGMTVLANAMLLGYAFALVQRRSLVGDPDSRRIDRIEYSERRELREVLLLAGALDHRLDAGGESGEASESFREWDRRIKKLSHSQDDIAQLRTLDIAFPEVVKMQFGILSNVEDIDPFELRCSFAQLGPTPHTRTILRMVLEYFRSSTTKGLVETSLIGEASVAMNSVLGLLHQEDLSASEAKRNTQGAEPLRVSGEVAIGSAPQRGFIATDKPFVDEGVQMIRTGQARSALEAAKMLVQKYGALSVHDWTPESTGIRSLSVDNTVNRLQKRISTAFKSRD